MEKFSFNFRKKRFNIYVKKLIGIQQAIGLMFSSRKKAKALLFEFKNPKRINLHSLFVFFPFLVLWLDDKNNVVDLKVVGPFRLNISSTKTYNKILEIPLNDAYKDIIEILVDGKGLKRKET